MIAVTGLGAILQASSLILSGIKVLGGLYLLYLAYGSYRSARLAGTPLAAVEATQSGTVQKKANWFRPGDAAQPLQSKAILVWMATLSLGATGDQSPLQVPVTATLCVR